MNRILWADFVLLNLNILWGYCYILIKIILEEVSPFTMLSLRFLIAVFVLFPFQLKSFRSLKLFEFLSYIISGLILSLGFIFQTLGLRTTSPGKAGVITGSLVVFVPIIFFLWTRSGLKSTVMFGSMFSFIGLIFISLDGGGKEFGIKSGDIYLLISAIAYALHIVVVDRVNSIFTESKPFLFTFIQLSVVGIFSFLLAIFQETRPLNISNKAIFGILFLSLLGTLLAYAIQMWAQKHSPPAHVGVILSTEAVFACIFSYFIFGEIFSVQMWIGSLLVLLGILTTQGILTTRRS